MALSVDVHIFRGRAFVPKFMSLPGTVWNLQPLKESLTFQEKDLVKFGLDL